MRNDTSLPLYLLLFILPLLGAGCFGAGLDSSKDGGLWYSSDAGKTWAQSLTIPTPTQIVQGAHMDILDLATDPEDPQALYAGTKDRGLLFSYDGGESWMRSPDQRAQRGSVQAVVVDPFDSCRVLYASKGKVLRSENCSRSFPDEVFASTADQQEITDLEADWFNEGTFYMSSTDGTIRKTMDGGDNWVTIYRRNQAISDVLVGNADSRVLLAGIHGAGIGRSADGGATWTLISDELKLYRDAGFVLGFDQDKRGSAIIARTRYGLLGSQDQGATWAPLELLSAPREVMIDALALDPNDPNHIWYGVANTVFESTNAGGEWSVERLKTGRTISDILIKPDDANRMWVGVHRIE